MVGGVTAPGGPDDGADPVAIDETRLRALPSAAAELSGDVTAFDVRRAVDETRERRDPVYWVDLEVPEGWVLIGDNGQGDEWWLGPRDDVWFFDHTNGERAPDRFTPMHLSVTEWLVVGHLLGAAEDVDEPDDAAISRLHAGLDAISPELSERWPYDLG